jgi:uncharacterized protein
MHVTFRFYEELNDFLPQTVRKRSFRFDCDRVVPVRSAIESLGVPHTEVDLILANGSSVDFEYVLREGDYVSVYPKFESFDITGLSLLRPEPLRCPRFIADVHLGKLARWLRLLGLDTVYRNDLEDRVIVQIAGDEQRIILTRDLGILKSREVDRGYFIRSLDPVSQAREVVQRFDLRRRLNPFSLCMECNHPLRKVSKKSIEDRIGERTRKYYNTFYLCQGCGRIFWKGSHYRRLKARIGMIITHPDSSW